MMGQSIGELIVQNRVFVFYIIFVGLHGNTIRAGIYRMDNDNDSMMTYRQSRSYFR
jgi:hypothetical protein